MKKQLLVALAVTAISASAAYATVTTTAGNGVVGSVHDMNSVGDGIAPDAQGRVCAFCHTPHHAIDASDPNYGDYMPLWSHTLTSQAYTQYGADSYTYDAAKAGAIDPLVGPTRLCMSCHDGSIAPDQHYGATSASNKKFSGNEFTGADLQIGIGANGALNRTHPIGFKLADAVAADLAGSNPAPGAAGFNPGVAAGTAIYKGNPVAKTIGSQLYNGYMTCATCHDVHNKDNATNVVGGGINADHTDTVGRNYLVFSPQSGSQLCLSCHNK